MRCSESSFERFANGQGAAYPWNRIKKTRRSHCCKWIATTGPTTSLFNCSVHHFVPTSSLPNGCVTSLIVEGVAIPVPPELDDIIDTIDCWGVCVSGLWKQKVIHVLVKKHLKGGEFPNRKSMCFSLIAMLLHELLGAATNSLAFNDMMFDYCDYYRSIYRSDMHFFQITVKCKRWFRRNYLQTTSLATASTVVTPERSTSLSASSVSTTGGH